MSLTDRDWKDMVFAQETAHAVRNSKDLRLPTDPEYALKALEARVHEIASKRTMTKGRVS